MTPALLIDVYDQCVVENDGDYPYVPLSYVWGGQQGLLATKANIAILHRPNSLANPTSRGSLPKTIRHTLGIAKLLGERYLWVDTLCIVQDGGSQKQEELSKMSGIYANSSVTILAIQGDHADSGLRGFSGISEPRSVQQVVHYLADGTKILQVPADGQFHDLECPNPVWSTRAWTYQENMCSRRKLIFDGDSLWWECMEGVWREHIDGTVQLDSVFGDVAACRSMLRASMLEFSEFEVVLGAYNMYQNPSSIYRTSPITIYTGYSHYA
ncbi:hypothetical protein QQX98_009206 [Neonectria punicea]|uniref:Heterokaryon incompatibility domain-containing protein n=1 Tax=Neonectria punicea TaxID=979145 RepID=A0ABR1GT36_9HYPO